MACLEWTEIHIPCRTRLLGHGSTVDWHVGHCCTGISTTEGDRAIEMSDWTPENPGLLNGLLGRITANIVIWIEGLFLGLLIFWLIFGSDCFNLHLAFEVDEF